MTEKFLTSVYKTAKPWVLGVIATGVGISVALNPHEYLTVCKSLFKIPVIILKSLVKDEVIHDISAIFIGSFFINLGLKLWDPIKFPLKGSKIWGLFFFNWGFVALLSLLMHLK